MEQKGEKKNWRMGRKSHYNLSASRKKRTKAKSKKKCALNQKNAISALTILQPAMKQSCEIKKDVIIEDEWISCQTDANKLVKGARPVVGSLFSPDESWPEESNDIDTKSSTEPVTTNNEELLFEFDDVKVEECVLEDMPLSYPEEMQQSPELKPGIEEFNLRYEKEETEEWLIKKQLCRCCLAEGTFDNMHSPALGEDISYDDMLMKSFNIQLFPVSSGDTAALRGVCGLCAARLRDAYAFQHQVHASEARFRDLYTRNCITAIGTASVAVELKQEKPNNDNEFENEIEDTPELLVEHIVNTKVQLREEGRVLPKIKKDPRKKLKADGQAPTKEYLKDGDKYMCIHCESKYTLLRSLRAHCKKIHSKPRACYTSTNEYLWVGDKYKCMQCENKYTLLRELRAHFKNTHRKPRIVEHPPATEEYTKVGNLFKCNKCERPFNDFRGVHNHFRRVHLKYPFLKCGHCETRFRSHIDLMSHTLEEHNIDERYKCGACEKVFNVKRQLQNHYNNYHKMGEKIKCSMCDFECYAKTLLKRHLVKHENSKDYKCKYCEKTFLRQPTLLYHERIHTGDKRKVCAECGQAFVQKASLNYHMAKHHPEVKF